jgi:hypothetical protein
VDAAQAAASQKDQPFALFFCGADVAKSAGEGLTGHNAYRREFGKTAPVTFFDNLAMQTAFRKAGIADFAKVAASRENLPLYQRYRAALDGSNSLVICAPSGDVMASFVGPNCSQTNVFRFLGTFKEFYAGWQKTQPKKK